MNTQFTGRRTLYRAHDGMLLGVCKGVANFAEIRVVWVRLLFILAFFVTAFFPVLFVYILAAVIMRPQPALEKPQSDEEWEFYHSYGANRSYALHRLKRHFESVERRIRRMEDIVTHKEYEWDKRLRENR